MRQGCSVCSSCAHHLQLVFQIQLIHAPGILACTLTLQARVHCRSLLLASSSPQASTRIVTRGHNRNTPQPMPVYVLFKLLYCCYSSFSLYSPRDRIAPLASSLEFLWFSLRVSFKCFFWFPNFANLVPWIFSSGSSFHLTGSAFLLVATTQYGPMLVVHTANGMHLSSS